LSFMSIRRHTRLSRDWSSDVCSSDLSRERTRARPLSRADRRNAIAAATVPLLVEHGAAVTTRQIADAAGVAEGTLFRAFADKDRSEERREGEHGNARRYDDYWDAQRG